MGESFLTEKAKTPGKRPSLSSLIGVAIVVHVLILLSVLDIYFSSPIEHGMKPHKPEIDVPPAKRVVLFVADGLRASSLFHENMIKETPFLYSVKENRGSWGIAHTQVPTESRPGHVAILAGFHEDPSAIFKGWQANPVEFDTVLNQSNQAVCFGSPDIVHLFNKNNLPHIKSYSYDAAMEDFSGKLETIVLDHWVFEKVYSYVEEAMPLRMQTGLVIFLHLLGIDTAGHSFKPHSEEYRNNIKMVDEEIKAFEKFMNTYFNDEDTAFIFTADHGMTDWGSHGAGSADETEVPIIAWGSGIAKRSTRNDVNLIDVASLLSAILGINYPINSLGMVPQGYIDVADHKLARIFISNALQIVENFLMKENKVKKTPILPFRSFMGLTKDRLTKWHTEYKYDLNAGNFKKAVGGAIKIMNAALEGIKYYDGYFQFYLSLLATSGFVGWMFYLISWLPEFSNIYRVIGDSQIISDLNKPKISTLFYFSLTFTVLLLQYMGLAYNYILYIVFPITCWYLVYCRVCYLKILLNWMRQFRWGVLAWYGLLFGTGVEMLIYTFFYRQFLVPLIIGHAWYTYRYTSVRRSILVWWGIITLPLCVMLFLPVMNTGYSSQYLFLALAGTMLALGYALYFRLANTSCFSFFSFWTIPTVLQILLLIIAFANIIIVKQTIADGHGLLPLNQYISWFTAGASLLILPYTLEIVAYRLLNIYLALSPAYLLMSGGIEPLFILFFSLFAFIWLLAEQEVSRKLAHAWFNKFGQVPNYYDYDEDLRRALILFAYIMLAFFGTGNLSSINSFDPTWVQTFVTVFSPFMMTILIIFKIIIPFLIVMCTFLGIARSTNMCISHVFTLVLLFCDIMVLHFFFAIKNEGSWLDIGISLSQFIIALVTTLILLLFYLVSKFLTTVTADKIMGLVKHKEF